MLWNLGWLGLGSMSKEMSNCLPDVYNKLLILVRDCCEPDEHMHLEVNEAIIPLSHPEVATSPKIVILKNHPTSPRLLPKSFFCSLSHQAVCTPHLQPRTP